MKVAGYAGFARALNRQTGQNVTPMKFGAAKTGLGLLGGVVYLFWLLPMFGAEDMSDAAMFLEVMPARARFRELVHVDPQQPRRIVWPPRRGSGYTLPTKHRVSVRNGLILNARASKIRHSFR